VLGSKEKVIISLGLQHIAHPLGSRVMSVLAYCVIQLHVQEDVKLQVDLSDRNVY